MITIMVLAIFANCIARALHKLSWAGLDACQAGSRAMESAKTKKETP